MNYVSDVLTEAKMFEWAGVGLGEENWYLISNAIKVLYTSIIASLRPN
jgi:hypothetical protein